MKHKLESRLPRKYQSPQIHRWCHPYARNRRGTKEPLDEGKRGEWKSWLETQHSKNKDPGIWFHHFIASRKGKVETVTDFFSLGSKITVDDDCSHEIRRCLLHGRKGMTNLDSVLNSKDITLPTKVCIEKPMSFPVVMYGCESWTVKKADHRRIDAFELWCWRRLLRDPWTTQRSHQSNLKENSLNILWKGWCWSWRSNTLATCCKELTH